jgi:diguanylate cyclase (GGDEF)-like protein
MADDRPKGKAPTAAAHSPETPTPYVIIAMANDNRATLLRSVALELTEDVALAPDGAAAKQLIARRGPPRLLITDLSLPTIDGFALVRQLRQTTPKHRSAVIVLSAHEALRTAARDLADSLGISKVLRIDTDRPALRAAVAAAFHEVGEARPAAVPSEPAPKRPSVDDGAGYEELLQSTVLAVSRQFQLPATGLYVKTHDRPRLVVYASAANPLRLVDASPAWTTLPQVASSGEPLIVPDVDGHPVFGDASPGSAVRGFASVPLLSPQGTSWGALCVLDTEPLMLDGSALEALTTHAQELGAKLEEHLGQQAAATFQALEHMAATDPLTGLANRRGGEKAIAGEISRAKREQKPLSCILIDIDRFKEVNDTYGHPAGDQLLREVSAIMRRSVRAYDIVSRWGGEEFLLVLPGADLIAARALAERIRAAVETLGTHTVGGVTVSAGIATFDEDYDLEATIRVADRRLYQAKAAGRNCVI